MSSNIKIYKINDFIRCTEEGTLDYERSIKMIHELTAAATYHTDHNILIDFRETTVPDSSLSDLMLIALEFAHFKSVFKNKLANVIPKDEERIAIANKFKEILDIKEFQYEIFTSFEEAMEWLSEITGPY